MPSPFGHALGGTAAGWLVGGRTVAPGPPPAGVRAHTDRVLRQAAGFAAIGMAPDLDLLVGLHSMHTHSVAAVVLVGAVAWFRCPGRGARWAVACAAALASHILLDWLGSDTTAPIGIMALWPFSSSFYQSPFLVFPAVSRRFGEWSFVVQNAKALMWEVVILVPITAAIGWARCERRAEALPHMRVPSVTRRCRTRGRSCARGGRRRPCA